MFKGRAIAGLAFALFVSLLGPACSSGTSCSGPGPCASGEVCLLTSDDINDLSEPGWGTCSPPSPTGGVCLADSDCAGNHHCVANGEFHAGRCSDSDVGSTCKSSADCPTGACSYEGQCEALLHGDELCDFDDECQSGICDGALNRCGPLPDGVLCRHDDACASGICACGRDGRDCHLTDAAGCGKRKDGGACGRDIDCQSGSCDLTLNTCGKIPIDDFCTKDEDCKSGACDVADPKAHFCGPADAGVACDRDKECLSMKCASGACVGVPDGGACTIDADCDTHACVLGICGLHPDGSPCPYDAACKSNFCNVDLVCAERKSNGKPCTVDNECKSDFCFEGTCEAKF